MPRLACDVMDCILTPPPPPPPAAATIPPSGGDAASDDLVATDTDVANPQPPVARAIASMFFNTQGALVYHIR